MNYDDLNKWMKDNPKWSYFHRARKYKRKMKKFPEYFSMFLDVYEELQKPKRSRRKFAHGLSSKDW